MRRNPNKLASAHLVILVSMTVRLSSFLLLVFRELKHGIPITDENDNRLGESSKAAQQAISQVVVSRILMAAPGMGTDVMLLWGEGSRCLRYA